MLLAAGLAQADRDGARTYIEASAKGLPLYLKHGWVQVDEISIDGRKYGISDGWICEPTLMRPPHAKR